MNEVIMAAFYDELTKHAGVPVLSSLKRKILNKFMEASMGLHGRGHRRSASALAGFGQGALEPLQTMRGFPGMLREAKRFGQARSWPTGKTTDKEWAKELALMKQTIISSLIGLGTGAAATTGAVGYGAYRGGKALHEKFKKTSSVKEAGMLKSYLGHLTGRTAKATKKSLLGASREVGAAKSNLAKERVKFKQPTGETLKRFVAEIRDPATSAARRKSLDSLLKEWSKDPKKAYGTLVNRKLKAFQSAGSRHSASLGASAKTKIKHQRAVYSRRRTRVLTGGAATGVLGGAGYEGYQHYKKKS